MKKPPVKFFRDIYRRASEYLVSDGILHMPTQINLSVRDSGFYWRECDQNRTISVERFESFGAKIGYNCGNLRVSGKKKFIYPTKISSGFTILVAIDEIEKSIFSIIELRNSEVYAWPDGMCSSGRILQAKHRCKSDNFSTGYELWDLRFKRILETNPIDIINRREFYEFMGVDKDSWSTSRAYRALRFNGFVEHNGTFYSKNFANCKDVIDS